MRYQYTGNALAPVTGADANTNELYGAATVGPVTLKYSRSTGNLFGTTDSKGSTYLDVTANFDLGGGYSFAPHLGYQMVKGDEARAIDLSYTDIALTLGKDLGNGLTASAALIGTNAKTGAYQYGTKQLGKTGLVVGIKYAF